MNSKTEIQNRIYFVRQVKRAYRKNVKLITGTGMCVGLCEHKWRGFETTRFDHINDPYHRDQFQYSMLAWFTNEINEATKGEAQWDCKGVRNPNYTNQFNWHPEDAQSRDDFLVNLISRLVKIKNKL